MQIRGVAFSFTTLLSPSFLRLGLLLHYNCVLTRYHIWKVTGSLEFITAFLGLGEALFIFFQYSERFGLDPLGGAMAVWVADFFEPFAAHKFEFLLKVARITWLHVR